MRFDDANKVIEEMRKGAVLEVNFKTNRRRLMRDGVKIGMVSDDCWIGLCVTNVLVPTHIKGRNDWRYSLKELMPTKSAERARR